MIQEEMQGIKEYLKSEEESTQSVCRACMQQVAKSKFRCILHRFVCWLAACQADGYDMI